MRPILFELPGVGIKIHSYGVMIFLACFAALGISVWRARREKINPNIVYELATWLFLGGVIGARGVFVALHPQMIHGVGDIFRSWQGGNVFYGCILGGLTGSLLYWYRHPFPFWPMADVAAPAVAIGAAIGRIGCFLNGCCDGVICAWPWGVRFPAGSHAWTRQANAGLISPEQPFSLPVHPTQLYAAVAALFVLGCLMAYFPKRRRPGQVIALLMILYSATRWPIEALRGDEPALALGMSSAQLISVALIAGGAGLWLWLDQSASEPDSASRLPENTQGSVAHPLIDQGNLLVRTTAELPPRGEVMGSA
jgi:phosphatidylglycerol---prolipoprotein diacylglyceryl transferase